MVRALKVAKPDEVYNLAAHSFVARWFGQPVFTADVNALGVARGFLEAVRRRARPSAFTRHRSRRCSAAQKETSHNAIHTPNSSRPRPYGLLQGVRGTGGHGQLPRGVRPARLLWRIVCNHEITAPRRGRVSSRARSPVPSERIKLGLAIAPVPGQPGCEARLGLCRRLRAGDVAHAATGRGRAIYVIATGVNALGAATCCELAFGLAGSRLTATTWRSMTRTSVPATSRTFAATRTRARESSVGPDRVVRGADPHDGRGRCRPPATQRGDHRRQRGKASCARWSSALTDSPAARPDETPASRPVTTWSAPSARISPVTILRQAKSWPST